MSEVPELSKAAAAERDRQRRLQEAIQWANAMTRAFKGLSGSCSRTKRALDAIAKYDLGPE